MGKIVSLLKFQDRIDVICAYCNGEDWKLKVDENDRCIFTCSTCRKVYTPGKEPKD